MPYALIAAVATEKSLVLVRNRETFARLHSHGPGARGFATTCERQAESL